jgi:predicted hydrocarbon binding protein
MLAEGLVLGSADHFGESVSVHQTSCKHRGDSRCTIRIEGAV